MVSYEEIENEWAEYCVNNLLEIGLSWDNIINSQYVTWKMFQENYDEYKRYDFDYANINKNIICGILKNNLLNESNKYYDWNYYLQCMFLSMNPNITWEIVQTNSHIHWDYDYLSQNSDITWEIVQENPDKPWSYVNLSRNPNITWEIVKKNPNKYWNITHLSLNKNITFELIKKNHWDYANLNWNPNITWEIVQENPNKPWRYDQLSQHPNITWDIVNDNPDKPWDYGYLSRNHNITVEIVQENPDKPWCPFNLCKNPNITFEFIKNNLNNWDNNNLLQLLRNKFTFEKEMFFRRKLQEWFKKSDLKRELIEKLWHPKNYEKFKYYDPEMFSEEEE